MNSIKYQYKSEKELKEDLDKIFKSIPKRQEYYVATSDNHIFDAWEEQIKNPVRNKS